MKEEAHLLWLGKKWIFPILFFFYSGILSAQETVKDSTIADTVKKGYLYNTDLFSFADLRYGYTLAGQNFGVGLNFKYKYNLIKLGYSYNYQSPYTRFSEISLTYGWSFRKNNLLFSMSAGVNKNIGKASNNEKGFTDDSLQIPIAPQVTINNWGVPLEMIISFTPPPKLKTFSSIGLTLFCNLNNTKSYFGGGINIGIGKVSPKGVNVVRKKDNPYKDYYQPKNQRPSDNRL